MKKIFALAALVVASTTHAEDFKGNVVSNTVYGMADAVTESVRGVKESIRSWDGPIGYPGNTWGTLVYAAKAPDGFPRRRIEGIVEQGVDWFRFGDEKKWKYNTFVAAEYVLNTDSQGVTPVIGMKVNRAFSDGSLDLGLRVKRGSTYLSPVGVSFAGGTERVTRTEVFATYWFAWNLKGK